MFSDNISLTFKLCKGPLVIKLHWVFVFTLDLLWFLFADIHTVPTGTPQSQGHNMHRTTHSQRRAGSPPLGLAKWFGSDVLQQPLPSMPSTKVISVDELEFRQ